MYRLVIADDEKRIRMGLKNIVDWAVLGFEVTELFSDGQEIIEYLNYVVPDVILTDIKMSHLSGLEVARYVYEHHLPSKVVLISGYQQFELALQGIRYGVEDYLLKPTDVNKLEETFQKIRLQLDETTERLRQSKAERERMEEVIPLMEEQFFGNLVMGVTESEEYIRNCMEVLYPQVDLEKNRCFLADLYIQDYEIFMKEVWEYSYDQLEVNLGNFFRIYQGGYSFHIVYKSGNLVEMIGISTEIEEEVKGSREAMEQLIQELERCFRFQAVYKIRQEYENVFQIGKMREEIWEKEDEQALNQYVQEQKKLVMSNITLGNIVTAQKLCRNILEELRHVSVMKRNNLVIDLLSTMNMVICEVNEKLARSLQTYFHYSSVLSMTRPEDLEAYLDRIFDRIRLAEEKKEYYDTDSLVAKAKAYIKDHLYEDISQEETANYLYICPSYLSRMFKKQTGESFLQYVTSVKMEKAIELLRDPKYKIYQVRELLGYKTPRYFSRLFRNYTGMNPSEYRGKVLKIGGEFDEE